MYNNSYIGSYAIIDHASPKIARGSICERSNTFTNCSNVNAIVDYGMYIRVQRLYSGSWSDCQIQNLGWTGNSSGTYTTANFSGDNALMVACEWGHSTVRSTHRSSGMWNDGTVKTIWAYSPGHPRLN